MAHDALFAIPDMPLPPLVRGEDRIPLCGPMVIAANHYERPGMWMVWPAIFLARLIRERTGGDTHFVAIETWESLKLFGLEIPPPLIKFIFERSFQVWGVLAMAPPNAPASARARSMRATVCEVREGKIIAIMPEGTVGPTPELLPAREGVGLFLNLLNGTGAPILPVGIFEEEGRLVAQVGEPLSLHAPRDLPKEERDRWASNLVMMAIRDLLPASLAGAYRNSPGAI